MFNELLIGYVMALAVAALAGLLVTRVTEHPMRIGFNLLESAANTFTTAALAIPGVPSISITRGATQAIGLEVMKVVTTLNAPDVEDDQGNTVTGEIIKGAAPTTTLGVNNNLTIFNRQIETENEFTTSGSAQHFQESTVSRDMTDGDGNGELVLDNEIHIAVLGSGNAAAKRFSGYLLAHLVEFDAAEAVFEIIEQAQ